MGRTCSGSWRRRPTSSSNRFLPATWTSLGLGYSALSQINPRVILTSITPFGQTGPYRDYKTCDLVSMALSGYMFLTGDPDRPPVRIGFPQAYLHAGMAAAAGTHGGALSPAAHRRGAAGGRLHPGGLRLDTDRFRHLLGDEPGAGGEARRRRGCVRPPARA